MMALVGSDDAKLEPKWPCKTRTELQTKGSLSAKTCIVITYPVTGRIRLALHSDLCSGPREGFLAAESQNEFTNEAHDIT